MAVQIPEDEYLKGLEGCKNNLHGRLLLSKGDTPIKFEDLRSKLDKLWKPIGNWKAVPIGKGFFEFSFSSIEDLRKVLSVGSWSLDQGLLRLFQWSPDFNPAKVKQTNTQCWVRILGLPQEYWRPKIIFAIARGIGVPLSLDDATSNRVLGHFARVLVDVDLAQPLRDRIMVERKGFAFLVDIQYERLPNFCSFCKMIGHASDKCKRKQNTDQVNVTKAIPKKSAQQYVPKNTAACYKPDAATNNDVHMDPIYGPDQVIDKDLRRSEDPVFLEGSQHAENQATSDHDEDDVETVFAESPISPLNDNDLGTHVSNSLSNVNEVVADSIDQFDSIDETQHSRKSTPMQRDLAIVSKFWANDDDDQESSDVQQHDEVLFKKVLTKSQKKKLKKQQKFQGNADRYLTRSRADHSPVF